MGKHSAQYVLYIRPTFGSREILHGMPFVLANDAISEGELLVRGGNYSYRVAEIDPVGQELRSVVTMTENDYVLPKYNEHDPLS